MDNENIKEILDKLKKTADNTTFIICGSQEELDKAPKYTANFLSINDKKAKLLLDYITNLQQENEELKKNQRYYKNGVFSLEYDKETLSDMVDDYKSRCEKASEIIKKEKENMGYAKYDSCLLLIENILKNGSDSQ